MEWNKEYLDLILVPSGLLIMFGYHVFLLYRYLTNYKSTSIGYENHTKKAWVKGMLQVRLILFLHLSKVGAARPASHFGEI